jgi:hypothetical protein
MLARERTWDVVVLDGAQQIMHRATDVSRTCKRLKRRRAWALTATPLENIFDELASVIEIVTPWTRDATTRLFPGPDLAEPAAHAPAAAPGELTHCRSFRQSSSARSRCNWNRASAPRTCERSVRGCTHCAHGARLCESRTCWS